MALLVTGLHLPDRDADPAPQVARHLGMPGARLVAVRVVKRSLDARRRPPVVRVNCQVELSPQDEGAVLARGIPGVRPFTERDAQRAGLQGSPAAVSPGWDDASRPVVVGAGPAGLFCALRLAEAGARPRLIERGEPVEARHHRVARHWTHGELDPESNVLFGEGGAGTFSDGKLHTRIRSGLVGYVLQRLVDFGAAPGILTEAHPHVGTDKLRGILVRMRQRLLDLGAEVRFSARVEGLLVERGRCDGVRLTGGEQVIGQPVVLATGHGAADSARCFVEAGLSAEARPFAVGARIEHQRALIDQARLGRWAAAEGAAAYRLVAPPRADVRQAYTFCMCPGGIVIPAGEREGITVVNGMSGSHRGSRWSNAAVVAPVSLGDFGAEGPLAGLDFRDRIERAAWSAGGGRFVAPAQRAGDLVAGRASSTLPHVSYPLGVIPTDLREVLPGPVIEAIIAALHAFERRIPGFAGDGAVLIAPETRTAAPWRFHRGEDRQALGVRGCYPIGEGMGWGGGIVSAAVDGVRTADVILCAGTRGRPGASLNASSP
jgi:uncharacterized FAD-dependent dehydrogenase